MNVITATRRLEWDAAHRVLRHESKCSTLHGHRYAACITVTAPELDSVGRVIDFGRVKEVVGAWIDDNLDHTTILNSEDVELRSFCVRECVQLGKRTPFVMDCEPTAENLSRLLFEVAQSLLGDGIRVVLVRVYETPNCYAECSACTP